MPEWQTRLTADRTELHVTARWVRSSHILL